MPTDNTVVNEVINGKPGDENVGKYGHSSNPPRARIPSTTRRYSLKSSPTSPSRRSPSSHSRKRARGGAMRIGGLLRGDAGRDACTRLVAPSNDVRRDGGEGYRKKRASVLL